jgi:hypothetical protein
VFIGIPIAALVALGYVVRVFVQSRLRDRVAGTEIWKRRASPSRGLEDAAPAAAPVFDGAKDDQ